MPPRAELDRLTMTDEMEPIDESTKYRRKIDHSLARFSAAHDLAAVEEARRRERLERLTARPAALIEQTRTALQRVVAATTLSPKVGDLSEGEPAERPARTRLQEKKQRRTDRSLRITRIIVIVLAALVLLVTGAAWGAKAFFNAQFTEVSALDENSSDIQNATAQTGDENFLMAGSDSRDGASAEGNVGDPGTIPGARSDTVMLAHIPADRRRVVVTSFPRDLEIDRPDCARWNSQTAQYTNEIVPGQKAQKLNTAYAVGGPQCLTKVIQKLTGMRLNHFVGIDFNGFKDMVDAVGGVVVHTDGPIDDTVLGMVVSQTGDVRISGDQALAYVRARHVKGDLTSDYGRIKRQQQFIGSLLRTVMSRDVMLDAGKLTGFITAFAKSTFGQNIGVDQLVTLAQSMRGLDPAAVRFLTVPTTGIANSRGDEVLVPSKARALFQALIDGTDLPSDGPAPTDAAPPPGTGANGAGTGRPQPSR